jgi:hypothetical protein
MILDAQLRDRLPHRLTRAWCIHYFRPSNQGFHYLECYTLTIAITRLEKTRMLTDNL